MGTKQKSVLAVVGDRSMFSQLARRLNRSALEVNLCHSAQTAIFFTSVLRFELIFVGHPLADASLEEFLAVVHRPGSPCADVAVLVLARAVEVPALQRSVGGDLVEILPSEVLGTDLEERVNRRLGTSALTARRVRVELAATVRAGDRREVLTSRNVSESGILLRTGEPLPVGSRVEIDLPLPGDSEPLRLAAEVVRHALPEQEHIEGMGLRFVGLPDGARGRLRRFLAESFRNER